MYEDVIDKIISVLTDDLLSPKWKKLRNPSCKVSGHCYIATEALWHIIGGQRSRFVPQVVSWNSITHWYLKDKRGCILDITKDQFLESIPYEKGRGCGFLTKRPSKRAREIIRRIGR